MAVAARLAKQEKSDGGAAAFSVCSDDGLARTRTVVYRMYTPAFSRDELVDGGFFDKMSKRSGQISTGR